MNLRRRLPALGLVVVALTLSAVIVGRVSAGADPAPHETTPIVLAPAASPAPTPSPTTRSPDDDDDDFDRTVPDPRDIDDDEHDDERGRDHPEDD